MWWMLLQQWIPIELRMTNVKDGFHALPGKLPAMGINVPTSTICPISERFMSVPFQAL
jgi:hypothetical protein